MSRTPVQHRTESLFRKLDEVVGQVSSGASLEAVHQLRTTVRRVETLISTHNAGKQAGLGKLGKQLARLRRRAGRVRDLDVQVLALRSIRLENGGRDKELLARHLAGLRDRQERRLLRVLHQELGSGLRKRLRQGAGLLADKAEGDACKDFTAEALCKFRTLVQGHAPLTEDNLHAFRMDCKRIRYLAEMSGDTPPAPTVVAELKRIQDAIGEWHDWLTLADAASQILPDANSPLIAALRMQRQHKFHEALRVTAEVRQRLLRKGLKLTQAPRRKLAA